MYSHCLYVKLLEHRTCIHVIHNLINCNIKHGSFNSYIYLLSSNSISICSVLGCTCYETVMYVAWQGSSSLFSRSLLLTCSCTFGEILNATESTTLHSSATPTTIPTYNSYYKPYDETYNDPHYKR